MRYQADPSLIVSARNFLALLEATSSDVHDAGNESAGAAALRAVNAIGELARAELTLCQQAARRLPELQQLGATLRGKVVRRG